MRGQAHTLEALVASLLVLGGIAFALQTTAVTPLSASTSNQHIGNQERAAAHGLMAAADGNETLTTAVVFYNTTGERFQNASADGYHNGGPPNAFGRALNETFGDERTAFNVVVRFRKPNESEWQSETMVDMGSPSADATAASRNVVLFDDTELSSSSSGNVSAPDNGTFYASDAADGLLFNVVEVRIIIWRI